MVLPDFGEGPVERRVRPSVASTTDNIPSGTLLTVPVAPPTGQTPNAPIVAVQTKKWYQSATLYVLTALPFVDFAAEQLTGFLNLNPNAHRVVILVLSIYLGWRRIVKNSVIR